LELQLFFNALRILLLCKEKYRRKARFLKLCGGCDLPLLLQDLQKGRTNSSCRKARQAPASAEALRENRRVAFS